MILSTTHKNNLISPRRSIKGKVELYNGSTLLKTFSNTDALKSFTVTREGSKKYFGYGICQKLEVEIVDKDRLIDLEKKQKLKVSFSVGTSIVTPTPLFYIADFKRDENTNELKVEAYDVIYDTSSYTIADLELEAPYTILDVVSKIVGKLGISFSLNVKSRDAFNIEYPEGANFDGTETLREVLDWIAEATQSIYYINNGNTLVFKHLDIAGDPVLTINKADYFTLTSKPSRTLAAIVSATELGDNVEARAADISGDTQYIHNNPFWELRDDIADIVETALSYVEGLSLAEFNCEWRGNYLLEPGDKIAIVAKDDSIITSFLLDNKYSYTGGLSDTTSWEYAENENESANNPSTLGDALKKTFAKVDKANAEIEIVAGETAAIKLTAESVSTSVTKLDNNVADLTNTVNTKVSAEDISFTIESALAEGVETVTTTTGYTFNEEGLYISKSDSEITTSITEDGMTVYRNNDEVLVADNLGVRAEDLHATTFLIIGNNSRLEDYGSRTGCFWIGR